jgi:hypothetical protein
MAVLTPITNDFCDRKKLDVCRRVSLLNARHTSQFRSVIMTQMRNCLCMSATSTRRQIGRYCANDSAGRCRYRRHHPAWRGVSD